MTRPTFFDCNASVGQRVTPRPEEFYSAESLLREMDYCGIESALVYHKVASLYDPVLGNRMILEECKQRDRLFPCFVVLPHHTGEFPNPSDLGAEMMDNDVRAVRVFPGAGSMDFSLAEWSCGGLFSRLAASGVPVFLDLNQAGWDAIASVLKNHSRLNLVVMNVGYRISRHLYPLMEQYRNLYLEISGYTTHFGIESACHAFGIHRLLFGANLPQFAAGPTMTMVNYAQLSDEGKDLIAGGNLVRLLDKAFR